MRAGSPLLSMLWIPKLSDFFVAGELWAVFPCPCLFTETFIFVITEISRKSRIKSFIWPVLMLLAEQ